MGRNYAIELVIPADRAEALLLATADVALRPAKMRIPERQWGQAWVLPSGGEMPPREETEEYEKPLTVHLPSGKTALLPFTSRLQTAPVDLTVGGNGLRLETVLAFPPDDALRKYQDDDNRFCRDLERDGESYTAVGLISLTGYLGVRYAMFSYTAATTQMSLLFQESRSVHATFLDLLARADGLVALFYQETDTYPLLSDPGRSVRVAEEDAFPRFSESDTADPVIACFADRFAESVLRQL